LTYFNLPPFFHVILFCFDPAVFYFCHSQLPVSEIDPKNRALYVNAQGERFYSIVSVTSTMPDIMRSKKRDQNSTETATSYKSEDTQSQARSEVKTTIKTTAVISTVAKA